MTDLSRYLDKSDLYRVIKKEYRVIHYEVI